MDIPGYLIITTIVVIFAIAIYSIGIIEVIPLYIRNEFDNICNNYSKLLSIQGYLDEADKSNLVNDLKNIGLNSIDISGTEKTEWGTDVEFMVQAYYEYESLNVERFSKSIERKPLTYKHKVKVFGFDN